MIRENMSDDDLDRETDFETIWGCKSESGDESEYEVGLEIFIYRNTIEKEEQVNEWAWQGNYSAHMILYPMDICSNYMLMYTTWNKGRRKRKRERERKYDMETAC